MRLSNPTIFNIQVMRKMGVMLFAVAFIFSAFKFSNFDSKIEEGGIIFQNKTWDEVLQLAKKEEKYIFLDVYASWCGPCKMLKRTTFSDKVVGSFYNENFINVAFDAEKGEGINIAQQYRVSGYPTLMFISPEGKVVRSVMGYHNSEQLLKLGEQFVK